MKTVYNGRFGAITLHRPYFWPRLNVSISLHEYAFELTLCIPWLIDIDFEVAYARNYYRHRGVYLNVSALMHMIELETPMSDGELSLTDEED